MRLIKYRSHALDPFVWFWIDDDDITVSPLFNTKEDAIDYAKKNKINYLVVEPNKRSIVKKSYADNFLK